MFDCPSKGFLIRKGQAEYHDYCAHCKGWMQLIMDRYDFSIEHERNDKGQCWWVMRKK